MLEKLLKLLHEKTFDKKPTVDELKSIEGFAEINSGIRDEAWKTYQTEQKKEADEDESGKAATVVTDKIEDQPTHRVTVKRDGFRRCGRAWQGSEEVCLSAEDEKTLEADAMFVVTKL
ncbi:hypothetical protein [Methylophaga nitratireducenticrescens]|uniref:hypothetical protein n=1 Tax=Methylophaga nitratireducenticrescens TaxID=754476 RepID=UPI000CDC1F63|nr:hypothetical protein [Methylophaga nitratireducenticrescens]AUZ85853.1 hypothetical protein CDW43_15330 [Methylophaga nitratireducenticrescens]